MAISRSNARSLVDEWMRHSGRAEPVAWETGVVARRVISWLNQTPLILDGCDVNFYRRFMKSLTRQVRYLRRTAYDGPQGLPRLRVMIALSAAALAMSEQQRFLKQASKWLDLELVRQILPDGGHVSRNPAAVLELLMDLLPLRQAFTARGSQPSRILLSAIDRMMPMLRFFRQGDGSFAHFNGCGDTASDQLATVLAYDDVRGAPLTHAPHSGYQRIEAGDAILLVDAGRPPPVDFSTDAHAGCLSFELSVGRQRLIINCGVPVAAAGPLRRLSRTTAAHSTASLNDTSSCRFLNRSWMGDWLGEAIIAGPTRVTSERRRRERGDGAAHAPQRLCRPLRHRPRAAAEPVRRRRPARRRRFLHDAGRRADQPVRQGRVRHPLPPQPGRPGGPHGLGARRDRCSSPTARPGSSRPTAPKRKSRTASSCPTAAATGRPCRSSSTASRSTRRGSPG